MVKLIRNVCENIVLIIEINSNYDLYLNIDGKIIYIGDIFYFKYSKLKYEIECNVKHYYTIFNWKDENGFVYINEYLRNIKSNKEVMRKIKLLKINVER